MSNIFKTTLLLTAMTLLLMLAGRAFGGQSGMLMALAFAGVVSGPVAILASVVGAIALVTGIVGFCPLYAILRVSTKPATR